MSIRQRIREAREDLLLFIASGLHALILHREMKRQMDAAMAETAREAEAMEREPWPDDPEPPALPRCSDCRHYWNRRSLCVRTEDPRCPDSPGRPWLEPEACAPPWCPGFELSDDAKLRLNEDLH